MGRQTASGQQGFGSLVLAVGLALVVSLAIAYGLFLVALSLGFDGPGSLTLPQAIVQAGLPVAGAVLGFAAILAIAHLVFHRMLAALVSMLPGVVISLYLISMIWRDAIRLVQP